MNISGWGKYPTTDAQLVSPEKYAQFGRAISQQHTAGQSCIARGLGRSYGDSSLADTILNTRYIDDFKTFDSDTGHLVCSAGASLAAILE